MNRAGTYLKKLFRIEPEAFLKPVIIAALLSGSILVWYIITMQAHTFPGTPAIIHGDSQEYITSAYNLFLSDYFYPNGKLPGYAVFLSFFLRCFGFKTALWGIILIQWAMHVLSVVCLARLAFRIRPDRRVYNVVFYAYGLSSYVVIYAACILSDSLAVSFTIFCFYFLAQSIYSQKSASIYQLTGICFLIMVFLRPVMLVAGIAIGIYFLIKGWTKRRMLLYAVLFFMPFLFGEIVWMRYNRLYHQDSHPLMSFKYYHTLYEKTYYIEACEFVGSWGGDFNFWDPTAELMYFGLGNMPAQPTVQLPEFIYTSAYNSDSLRQLRDMIALYEKRKNVDTLRYIKQTFHRYQRAFETEKPVLHFLSGFRSLKKFLINGWGAYNLYPVPFSQLDFFNKGIKLVYVGFYLVFGLFGWGCLLWQGVFRLKKGYSLYATIAIMIILMTLILTFFFRYCEYRYFAPLYPFTLLASCLYVLSFSGMQKGYKS